MNTKNTGTSFTTRFTAHVTKVAVVLTAALMVACGGSKSASNDGAGGGGGNCAIPGQVVIHGVCGYPNNNGSNKVISFEQWVNVTDLATYRTFLRDLDYCSKSQCKRINYMSVRLDLVSTSFPSQARVAIGTGYGYPFMRVGTAYPISGGFEFRVTGMFGTPSWNDVVRVVATPSNAQMNTVDVTVYYNNVAFANGRLSRVPAYQ